MIINRKAIRVISLVCALNLIFTVICSAQGSTQDIPDDQIQFNTDELSAEIFADYMGRWENPIFPKDTIDIVESDTLYNAGDIIDTTVNVNESGFYALKICHMSEVESIDTPSFSITIGETLPYYEASNILLPKIYRDDYSAYGDSVLTNESIPEQIEITEYSEYYCFDTIGYYGGILYFYLEKGENAISLTVKSGSVYIKSAAFTYYENPTDYKSAKQNLVEDKYTGENLVFESEKMEKKSNTSVLAINDASSASVSPSSPTDKLINAVGGSNFAEVGQYIEWKFTVPKDGLYSITFKYRQEINVGMNSYRRILIDGEVPYSELEQYAFPYNSTFTKETLNVNGEAMQFALSKGEHTLRMQVVIGGLSELLPYVNKVVNTLTEDYRRIIMITGTKPDTLRDYFLENSIPETLESLATQKKEIDRIWKELEALSSSSSAGSKTLGALSEQLALFGEDSYNITKNLPSFKSNISALCNWLLEAKRQPIKFDYFVVSDPSKDVTNKDGGFFESVIFNIKSFLFTFSKDYAGNSLGSRNADTISVWVTGSSAKYNILYRLIRGDFEKNNPNIKVDLKLVTATAKLANSIAAGKNPDIALDQESTAIMNMVFRNAVTDLSRFEDSSDVLSRFRDTALVPITYNGKVYAMPNTQVFSALYYRTDVLSEMGLTAPESWQDVVYILSELKKNNLEFGIPHNMNTFVSMMYQTGGKMYNENGTATALNSPEAIEAFTNFTSFFTDYSAPLTFNELNRFRTGEMPILLANISFYNTLKVLAPEIEGRWEATLYPGTDMGKGNIDHTQMATVTGDVILNENKAQMCWEFLKWKTTDEIQLSLSENYEMALGSSERLMTANAEAFKKLGWSQDMLELIENSESSLCALPAVPGSYYVTRHISNAISRVIYNSEVPGDALLKYAAIIDAEIEYETEWFGLREEQEMK